ncbi:hypothetical protein RUND412_004145 [Rhizina undulata]
MLGLREWMSLMNRMQDIVYTTQANHRSKVTCKLKLEKTEQEADAKQKEKDVDSRVTVNVTGVRRGLKELLGPIKELRKEGKGDDDGLLKIYRFGWKPTGFRETVIRTG